MSLCVGAKTRTGKQRETNVTVNESHTELKWTHKLDFFFSPFFLFLFLWFLWGSYLGGGLTRQSYRGNTGLPVYVVLGNWIHRVLVVCFLVPKETKCNLKPGWAGWISGCTYPSPIYSTHTHTHCTKAPLHHSATYGSHKASYRLAGFADNPGNTLGSTTQQLLWFPPIMCYTIAIVIARVWWNLYVRNI